MEDQRVLRIELALEVSMPQTESLFQALVVEAHVIDHLGGPSGPSVMARRAISMTELIETIYQWHSVAALDRNGWPGWY